MAITQTNDEDGLAQLVDGKRLKIMVSKCILKVEQIEFADVLCMRSSLIKFFCSRQLE